MGLQLPQFESEKEEAEWWFNHRAEVEAVFLLAASEGCLQRRTGLGEDCLVEEPAHALDPEMLREARELLERSEIWTDNTITASPVPTEKLQKAS
jgi:hypothetical protein